MKYCGGDVVRVVTSARVRARRSLRFSLGIDGNKLFPPPSHFERAFAIRVRGSSLLLLRIKRRSQPRGIFQAWTERVTFVLSLRDDGRDGTVTDRRFTSSLPLLIRTSGGCGCAAYLERSSDLDAMRCTHGLLRWTDSVATLSLHRQKFPQCRTTL